MTAAMDENVFDIQQGVAIAISYVKHSKDAIITRRQLLFIIHADLLGERQAETKVAENPGWLTENDVNVNSMDGTGDPRSAYLY